MAYIVRAVFLVILLLFIFQIVFSVASRNHELTDNSSLDAHKTPSHGTFFFSAFLPSQVCSSLSHMEHMEAVCYIANEMAKRVGKIC